MLDWEGNLKPKKEREYKIVLDDIRDGFIGRISPN
jgi:hypothetical protein